MKTMAITIDDLPVAQMSWHSPDQMDRITNDLLSTLAEHEVPAVGFVNEVKLEVDGEVDPFRLEILRRWLGAGNELGNHGYSHLDLHRVSPGEWMADVTRGEVETLKQRIGRDYVRYMLEVVEFYEGQSQAIVGRQIPQVLLIHAYALNADWLDTLLLELEGLGYRWITLGQALEDPSYQRPIGGWTGRGGITWLHRWAITEGLDRSLFEGEPVPSAWIEEIP